MNILLTALIAILTIFALKKQNNHQTFGIGNYRFSLAIACAIFPYLDVIFNLSNTTDQLLYQNSLTWSLLLSPFYIWIICLSCSTYFKEKMDMNFIVPSVAATMAVVLLFNTLNSEGIALFFPISNYKVGLDILYNFDLTLCLILLTGVSLLFVFKKRRKDVARVFLIITAIYIVIVASFSLKAYLFGKKYVKALNIEYKNIYVFPQPLSIFNWRIMIISKNNKIHDTFISLKQHDEDVFESDKRTNRVAKLYKQPNKAVWRIYRKDNPLYKKYYAPILHLYKNNKYIKTQLEFSVIKGIKKFNGLQCIRFKDIRSEGIRKSLKGNLLFCEDNATKQIHTYYGTKKDYKQIFIN